MNPAGQNMKNKMPRYTRESQRHLTVILSKLSQVNSSYEMNPDGHPDNSGGLGNTEALHSESLYNYSM